MAAPEAPERPQIHSVDFHVTNACNLGCVYCYGFDGAGYLNRPDGMTWDVAERAIGFLCEHAPEKRPFTLYFFGGEPLLNFRLIERIIPFAKSEFAEAGKRIQSP